MIGSSAADIVDVPLGIDLAAVALGGLSGAVVAVRHGFDLGGILVLSIVTGLGGGILRDTLLQRGTPVALTSPWLLPVAIAAGCVVALFSESLATDAKWTGAMYVVLDAGFLAVYASVGTAKALDAGLPAVTCVLLGVATGTGGGLLRDVVVNTQPDLLRPGTLLVSAAAVGAAVEVLMVRQVGFSRSAGYISIVVVVSLRLVSVWRGWESPRPTDVRRAARRYAKGSADGASKT
ncbi:MAG: hypothetical protein RL238_2766 [Actinomycetota bacterium]|jgi:uncharacterized membrane protein YeiH